MNDLIHSIEPLRFVWVVCLLAACVASTQWVRAAEPWAAPRVSAEALRQHPRLAATPEELARLRAAWKSAGPAHNALAAIFTRADHVIAEGLDIPQEGGQHNQWYQCEPCQMGLKTVDPTHHKCPKCGKVYSGYPYDNVLYNHRHRQASQRINDAGWAYAATGEQRYARFVGETLLQYAELYLKLPILSAQVGKRGVELTESQRRVGGRLNSQTLDEAMWVTVAAPGYDLVRDSGVLTDAQKQTIEQDLFRPMAEQIGGHPAGKSNWQTWHNAALLYAGAVLGDDDLVNRALHDGKNGFTRQMEISVLPEGMWYENSWGYHYYTLLGMTRLAEGARRLGVDLYGHPMLRKMYLIAFDYRLSDGSLPRFGDATGGSPRNDAVNEPAYHMYRDERILSTLPGAPTFDSVLYGRDTSRRTVSPAPTSKLFPGAGHAVLHTNGPGKLSAAIAFGPYGGFHGHFDKLGFVFFGYGTELGADPGRAASQAYRLPIHSQWYKATIGHNTVLVDGKDQSPATGELFSYAATDAYAAVAAGAGDAFKEMGHTRFLLLTPHYLLVVDELTPRDGAVHAIDWVYHNRGSELVMDLPPAERPGVAGAPAAPTTYLENVRTHVAGSSQSISGTFRGDDVDVHMTSVMHSTPDVDLTITAATGPLGSVTERVPMVIVHHPAADSRVYYVTALEPLRKGDTPTVDAVGIEMTDGTLTVAVTRPAGREQVSFSSAALTGAFVVERVDGRGTPQVVLRSSPTSEE